MPHDVNNVELKVGDVVSVKFRVTTLYPGAELCNVSLTRAVAGEQQLSITCQTKQCELEAPDALSK